MRQQSIVNSVTVLATSLLPLTITLAAGHPTTVQEPIHVNDVATPSSNITIPLFAELEELSRIVDISYCVGTSGISHPFLCASRCDEFPNFELMDTFNTGPLMSDSCGYVVMDHGKDGAGEGGRIIIAFRGTYSIANTIVDLSTVPQEYVPYPGEGGNETGSAVRQVHTGFWTSWQNTRPLIIPHLKNAFEAHPTYSLHLVGHSLGGAVAALAGLELDALGWEPTITTFGEPRVGNAGLRDFIDASFGLDRKDATELVSGRYRRVTHVDDPVPLLPLQEWGYRPHAGEVFISKPSLQPGINDIHLCAGDEDVNCLSGAEAHEIWFEASPDVTDIKAENLAGEADAEAELRAERAAEGGVLNKRWGIPIPARYKMWQLFFAHRDYFWRLGLCVPGGDPLDWGREHYDFGEGDEGVQVQPEL